MCHHFFFIIDLFIYLLLELALLMKSKSYKVLVEESGYCKEAAFAVLQVTNTQEVEDKVVSFDNPHNAEYPFRTVAEVRSEHSFKFEKNVPQRGWKFAVGPVSWPGATIEFKNEWSNVYHGPCSRENLSSILRKGLCTPAQRSSAGNFGGWTTEKIYVTPSVSCVQQCYSLEVNQKWKGKWLKWRIFLQCR